MSLLDALLLDPYRINVWIAYRTDGVKGSGTQNDPYDGSTATRFDSLMSGFAPNTTVHLGPTTTSNPFQTTGFWINNDGSTGSGWEPKAGMKIIGSGIDVTTLKLVNASGGALYFAIGHTFTTSVDYFEASDLTIDCNLTAQGASLAAGAVRVLGNHSRVRRVKVTNWGSKSGAPTGYVIAMITGEPTYGFTQVIDTGIEDCIVVNPDTTSGVGPVSVLHVGSRFVDLGYNVEAYGTGGFIRNCFVDSGSPTTTADIRALSMSWCKGGIIEGNQVHNTKYGGPYASEESIGDLTVRNNFYKNVQKGPFWNLATNIAGSLSSLVRDSGDNTIAVATSSGAHGMLAGDRVRIDVSGAASYYEGIFVIKDVPSSTTFRYQMQGDPGGNGSSPTMQKIFGVGKLVVEGNTVELATGSTGLIGIHLDDASLSPQAPDYAHGDVVIRDNKIRYVDGFFDSSCTGYGLQLNGVKNLLVRNNVVECYPSNPLRNNRCGSVEYFNDKTPAGVLIQGINEDDSNKKYDELETDAEDALVLALMKKR